MFTDRSDLLLANPPMLGYGVAVFDRSGQGEFAFFVAGFGFPNRVLAWEGSQLIDHFDRTLASTSRQAIGVAAADIDGDGREEIYVLNTDTFAGAKEQGDHLFAFRGGAWKDLFAEGLNSTLVNRVAGRSVAAIDRYGKGRYGFVVANYGGPLRLYECVDPKRDRLMDAAEEAGIDYVTGGRALICLPLLSEKRMDIFAANENGPNFLFVNQGRGAFEEMAEELGVADPVENGRGVAALDADSNGRFDLVVGNWQGEHRMFLQSYLSGFMNDAPPEMARPCAVRTVIAADFDNDGYEEILFNNIGEPNRLFGFRDGVWRRIPIGAADEPNGLGTGAAVADLDGDGRLELLIAHGEMDVQPLSLYHAEASDNNWLRVYPLTRAGAPARGALVTLSTARRIQRRVIDAGSGYLCQMEPVAHFGLGGEADVENVTVTWPGGLSLTIDRPDIGQTLRVPYPS